MAALVFLLLGLIIAAAIVITRFDRVYWLLWLLPVILLGGGALVLAERAQATHSTHQPRHFRIAESLCRVRC